MRKKSLFLPVFLFSLLAGIFISPLNSFAQCPCGNCPSCSECDQYLINAEVYDKQASEYYALYEQLSGQAVKKMQDYEECRTACNNDTGVQQSCQNNCLGIKQKWPRIKCQAKCMDETCEARCVGNKNEALDLAQRSSEAYMNADTAQKNADASRANYYDSCLPGCLSSMPAECLNSDCQTYYGNAMGYWGESKRLRSDADTLETKAKATEKAAAELMKQIPDLMKKVADLCDK